MKSTLAKLAFTCLAIVSLAAFAIPTFSPPSASAAQCSDKVCSGSYPDSVKAACGCSGISTKKVDDAIANVLNAVIGMLGIIAVIFIIVGGVKYMTSAGDPGKVKSAKDTILYALIGLVVCALAFAITNFVINAINGS
jgi:hypothetical protein